MASSIKLYTTGNMEAAHLHNSPNYTAGYPPANCLDGNLDTIWKIGVSVVKTIDIDLSSTKTVGAVLLFVNNYLTAVGGCEIWWSDNGSSWTQVSGNITMTDTATPIRIKTSGLSLTHRYWRFVLSYANAYSIGGIWCSSYYSVAQGNVLPQGDEDQFFNRVSQLPGGRLAVAGINRNYVENPSRRYLIKAGTPYSNMLSAFQDSRGIRHLLIMNEGASQSDARVVRFADDVLPHSTVGYDGLYEIGIALRGVPYVDNGDTF